MVSVYCAIGIYSTIGAIVYGLYRRGSGEDMLRLNGWGLYILSRIIPILMLAERSGGVWRNLILDLAVFLLLDRLTKSQDRRFLGRGGVLYALNPAALMAIVSGQLGNMMAVCLLAAGLVLLARLGARKIENFSAVEFYPEYVCLSCCAFYGGIVRECLPRAFSTVLLLAGTVGILTVICCIRKILKWKESPRWFCAGEHPQEMLPPCEQKVTRRDLAIMMALTALFAVMVFWRLGSFEVPETNLHLERSGAREIMLDLGRNVALDRIEIYLGHQKNRVMSFSYAPSGGEDWILLRSKINVKRCYEWNEISMGVTARYVGIVTMSESADILELVLLDANGNQIMPLNASAYPTIFDEQQRYPEHQTYFDRMIFDESHYGRTAYDFLNGQLPSEVTHPPLGKVLLSVGIGLFGMNPLGWRCISALFGLLMVPLVYLFALRFSGKSAVAATAAILLCTEFMHLALSRLATLGTIVSFFSLLTFYWMYRFVSALKQNAGAPLRRYYPLLLLCGCAMGCAIATKFTGCYAAAGTAVIFFVHMISYCRERGWEMALRREMGELFLVCAGAFIVIPAVIYVMSYIPFARAYPDKTLLETLVDNTKYMLSYHSGADFEHTYASPWYTWLINLRPIPDAINRTKEGYVSTLATLGNPLVVFGGLAALVHQCYLWLCRKDMTARFLTIAYLSALLPWWIVQRTVFIYHYFDCILILVLMLAHSAQQGGKRRNLVVLSAISCLLLAVFYPVLSGTETAIPYVENVLEWLESWVFV